MTAPQTPALTVGNVTIHQRNGLFSLNDLHQASGGEAKHQPSNFIRLDTTQALITEIQSSDVQSAAISTINGGKHRGTYACRELVIAYASWINPEFQLKVIRVFLDTQTPPRTPYSVHPGQTLTAEQADTLRLMLQTAVEQLPKEKQGQAAIQGWAKLKSHFKVGYRQIPQKHYSEALNLLARHVADIAEQAPQPVQASLFDQTALHNIAGFNGILQQILMQEILLPIMTGAVNAGQRWVLTLAPDDLGNACIPLLHRLGADAIISRALEMPAGQQRTLRLAAFGSGNT